jgi:hypothetical protein
MILLDKVERVFRRVLGLPQPPASRDDMINASIENRAREHSDLVGALHKALKRRTETNEALRRSIRIAKHRTNSFADFERMAIRREEMK